MRSFVYSVSKRFLRIFYDNDVLESKWFNRYHVGYLWAFRSIFRRIKYKDIKVPFAKSATIFSGRNLEISPSSINCLQSDIYLNNRLNKVIIGEHCYIANHVGLITEQHDIYNLERHLKGADIIIGNWCWIGMNSVVMPGVVLGDHTTVGANSVVTRSFPDGYVVIAGAPAKEIRKIDKSKIREINK